MVAELIVDAPVSDPYTWQTSKSLADLLRCSERTIRGWVKKGKTEKTRTMDGGVYYRLIRQEMEDERIENGNGGDPRSAGSPDPLPASTLIEMTRELQTLTEKHQTTVIALHERITAARVEAAEVKLLAEVATRDAEREAERADRLEREALRWRQSHEEMTRRLQAEELRRERAEMFSTMLAATPWWAFGKRAQLRAAAETLALTN